jgi:hypothetical protein
MFGNVPNGLVYRVHKNVSLTHRQDSFRLVTRATTNCSYFDISTSILTYFDIYIDILLPLRPGNEPWSEWENLTRGSPEYEAKKQKRAEFLWRAVEKAIPDVRKRVEVGGFHPLSDRTHKTESVAFPAPGTSRGSFSQGKAMVMYHDVKSRSCRACYTLPA